MPATAMEPDQDKHQKLKPFQSYQPQSKKQHFNQQAYHVGRAPTNCFCFSSAANLRSFPFACSEAPAFGFWEASLVRSKGVSAQ
ncbi:hypothetical protein QOT17_025484 [Balamuthia mandrillaris]